MRLVHFMTANGNSTLVWINPDHVASVTAADGGGTNLWEATDDDNPWRVTTDVAETVRRLMGVRKLPDDVDDEQPDLASWTRLAEVREYARRYGITVPEAIRRLTNSGLSHHQGPPLTAKGSRP